jgi:hypothetical protein
MNSRQPLAFTIILFASVLYAQGPLDAIPSELRLKWKKFGVWDYKQQSSKYRDFTQFNFGSTAAAAGVTEEQATEIYRAAKPTPRLLNAYDDGELEKRFASIRKPLEQLRTMAAEEKTLFRITPEFTLAADAVKWPREDPGLSRERWDTYRELFKKAGVAQGFVKSEDFPKAVFFIDKADGLSVAGISRGYVYSDEPLPVVLSAASFINEKARANPKDRGAIAFKALDNNWYSFYEIDW